jgi:hypothetical protein
MVPMAEDVQWYDGTPKIVENQPLKCVEILDIYVITIDTACLSWQISSFPQREVSIW